MKDRAVRLKDVEDRLSHLDNELRHEVDEAWKSKVDLVDLYDLPTFTVLRPLSKEVIDGLKKEEGIPNPFNLSAIAELAKRHRDFNAGLDKALECCGVKEVSVEEMVPEIEQVLHKFEASFITRNLIACELAQAIHNLYKGEKKNEYKKTR